MESKLVSFCVDCNFGLIHAVIFNLLISVQNLVNRVCRKILSKNEHLMVSKCFYLDMQTYRSIGY